jgi:hypothetical protein
MWATIAALGGVILGAGLGYWFQRALTKEATKERWQRQAADALADLEILLTDAHPDRVAINLDREAVVEQIAELKERGTLVRREVAVLAAGHPDPDIRAVAKMMQVGIFNTLSSVGWLVSDMLQSRDFQQARQDAVVRHDLVTRLAEQIRERLHT